MSEYLLTPEERAIGAWLTAVLPVAYAGRVLAADQRHAEIDAPFVTFKFREDVARTLTPTHGGTRVEDGQGNFETILAQTTNAVVVVHAYGPASFADLRQIKMNMCAPSIVEQTRLDGVVVQSVGRILRLPRETSLRRQDHATIDLAVQYVLTGSYLTRIAQIARDGATDIDLTP